MINSNYPVFEELKKYKGYDWSCFLETKQFRGKKSKEELISEAQRYINESIEKDSVSDIITDLSKYAKNMELVNNTIYEYILCILEHEEFHKYLKRINDGSYRINKIMYNINKNGYECIYTGDIKTENRTPYNVLQNMVKRDGVLFIQKNNTPCKYYKNMI